MCFTQTANLSDVLVNSLPNTLPHIMTMVLIESSQKDCNVTIGSLSHDKRHVPQREAAYAEDSVHTRHPIVLEEHLITRWKEGEGH